MPIHAAFAQMRPGSQIFRTVDGGGNATRGADIGYCLFSIDGFRPRLNKRVHLGVIGESPFDTAPVWIIY